MNTIERDGLKFSRDHNLELALIIESDKIQQCKDYIISNPSVHIFINSFHGFTENNLENLEGIESILSGLYVVSDLDDIRFINQLHKLKYLAYSDNGKDTIDLSKLPELEMLACDYSDRLQGLNTCEKLKSLSLTNFKSKNEDIALLPPSKDLIELQLLTPKITSLTGIEQYKKLRKLDLYGARKLESISPLKGLSENLEEIEIQKCKTIKDFETLGEICALKKIMIGTSGNINSLSFITKLNNLEFLSFVETNVLDGNLSYCTGLKYVGFDDKRHYSHKMKDFPNKLKKTNSV